MLMDRNGSNGQRIEVGGDDCISVSAYIHYTTFSLKSTLVIYERKSNNENSHVEINFFFKRLFW